jgi:hypothetical protein
LFKSEIVLVPELGGALAGNVARREKERIKNESPQPGGYARTIPCVAARRFASNYYNLCVK